MIEPKIIFEDSSLLVLDKPAGLAVHGFPGNTEPTLADWLLEKYPDIESVGEPESLRPTPYALLPVSRCGLVHRLDRETSGVIVVAKTLEAYLSLKQQFSSGSAEEGYEGRPRKTYQALVYGLMKDDQGEIHRSIGRSRVNPKLRIVGAKASGTSRDALTYYKVLERFNLLGKVESFEQEERRKKKEGVSDFTFLECYPRTGRTHQVRVHLGSIGRPVVCDKLYAPGKPCLPGLTRHALHAASIDIMLPTGERKVFSAPLPIDMAGVLENLHKASFEQSTKHEI
ncbi:MAG: hypothetical protein COV10_02250 [Candidatus Vogelbacteria bacterium CG10_big_fil_rev_8_21_14_0_10_51_16]|uniref:Pseudouridine synthase RsuA/RluA-like domain-containing protein n=1 Tax=Candidatus Vogelbacteria bacterium CG10_big_fil_rev_8_21_14_0_10_51_16 TaxID=1975045 RepID=A0A2H0RED9_9BACT|nr:MAG: hypothetical protein COV10_02250 [Candidatus Vogelbacteria bacterium CG10_big_fil_rev_8_21_14_0_10_51_16]